MTTYHRMFIRFWQSPKVRRWPDHQKLLATYLLTCQHRTTEGLFWLPHGYVAQDLGWSIERVSEGYSGLFEAQFCVYHDASETVLLLNALKYERPAGPLQIKGAINRLAEAPASPLFTQLRDAAGSYAPDFCKALDDAPELQHHRDARDTPSKGYQYPSEISSSSSSSSSSSRSNPVVTGNAPAAAALDDDPDPREHPPQARAQPAPLLSLVPSDDTEIVAVFQTWQHSTGKHRAKLDNTRRAAITAALKAYDLEDVLAAVQGWANDPWPDRPQHNDLVQLLWMGSKRKPQNVLEKMAQLWRDGPPVTVGRRTRQMLDNAHAASGLREVAERLAAEGGERRGPPRVGSNRQTPQRQLARPAD